MNFHLENSFVGGKLGTTLLTKKSK